MKTETKQSWARLHTSLLSSDKWLESIDHPTAALLYINSIMWCFREDTDGLITPAQARRALYAEQEDIDYLVSMGMWDNDGRNYRVHDYLDWQESSEERRESAEKRSDRAKRAAEARWGKKKPVVSSEHCSSDAQSMPVASSKQCSNDARLCQSESESESEREINNNLYIAREENFPASQAISTVLDRPDFEALTERLADEYPLNRFDGRTTMNRLSLEANWERIREAAGDESPESWLIRKVRDYRASLSDMRYCQRWSKWLNGQGYLMDYAPYAPPMGKAAQNAIFNRQLVQQFEQMEGKNHGQQFRRD